MRNYVNAPLAVLTAFLACSCSPPAPSAQVPAPTPPAGSATALGMVIHTGAGNFTLAGIAERKDAMQTAMNDALMAVVQGELKPIGGEGGVISLDARGNVMMSFNTAGMGRGYVGPDGKPTIMFTADDGK